jgi:hypothetical protein
MAVLKSPLVSASRAAKPIAVLATERFVSAAPAVAPITVLKGLREHVKTQIATPWQVTH